MTSAASETAKHPSTNAKRIKRGDKVAVPWGLDEIVGDVEEVYGPSVRNYVVVRVPTYGPTGEILDERNISPKTRFASSRSPDASQAPSRKPGNSRSHAQRGAQASPPPK